MKKERAEKSYQIKERPILFNSDMVRAIMGGRKTETRRVAKHQFWQHHERVDINVNKCTTGSKDKDVNCPYGKLGDVLWVRETHAFLKGWNGRVAYKADYPDTEFEAFKIAGEKWKPSIFMPKNAARIWLRVTDVRIERLQEITKESSEAEGIDIDTETGLRLCRDYAERSNWMLSPKDSFKSLWQSLNGPDSWEQNPWVWVVHFEVISTNGKPDSLRYKQLRVDEEAEKYTID